MKNIRKKLTMVFGAVLCAVSFNVLADDCYYAFLSSSAANSCTNINAHFMPGSEAWCGVYADCFNGLNGQYAGYVNNDEVFAYVDVPSLVNCNGTLKIGSCSSKAAKTINLPKQPAQRIIRKQGGAYRR